LIGLRLNGIPFQPQPLMATAIMIEVAAGAVSEDGLARWIRDQWPHP